MGFFKENKHANGTTSTDWGGSIAGGFGGVEGIAVAFMVFVGAIVGGGFALLWFAITGYKKFNLGKVSRIIALVLSIVYGYIVYTAFASGKPDLMLILYGNIGITVFFIGVYLISLPGKNKYIAVLLAFFFGQIGLHKFYIGCKSAGFIYLGSTIITIIMIYISMTDTNSQLGSDPIGLNIYFVIGTISGLEALTYLFRSKENFKIKNIDNKKCWF